MNKLQAKVTIKKENDTITVVASDETLDRHGEVLPIDQWDLSKFIGSPRMLVDHNHQVEKIVGKWVNPRVENKQLLFDAVFHEYTELSKAVKQMVEGGFLNTVSVGFIPHGPKKDGDRETFELIETSWVTVPANPSATVVNRMKALEKEPITPEQEEKIKDWVKSNDEEEELDGTDPEDSNDDDEQEVEPDELPPEEGDVITSVESFRAWQNKKSADTVLKVDVSFLQKIIEDSEQLQALTTDKKKVEAARKKKLLRLALKEVASTTSHLLRELKKSSD